MLSHSGLAGKEMYVRSHLPCPAQKLEPDLKTCNSKPAVYKMVLCPSCYGTRSPCVGMLTGLSWAHMHEVSLTPTVRQSRSRPDLWLPTPELENRSSARQSKPVSLLKS